MVTRKRLILEIVKVQKDWSEKRQKAKEIKRQIRDIKQQNQLSSAMAIANAKDIDYIEHEQLLAKHTLTEEERSQIHKYNLRQRYGVAATPFLKLRDDKGYYYQLLVHYYLTHESEYFHIRDQKEWYQQLSWGDGKVFLPDLKTYTCKVEAMRALGILQFLEAERKFTENDSDLMLLKDVAFQHSQHIKRVLSIDLVKEQGSISTIKILGRLLNLLGLKLKRVNDIYQIDPETLFDGREQIFTVWHQRDELMLMNNKIIECEMIASPPNSSFNNSKTNPVFAGHV